MSYLEDEQAIAKVNGLLGAIAVLSKFGISALADNHKERSYIS